MTAARRPVVWLAVVAAVAGLLGAAASRGEPAGFQTGVRFAVFVVPLCGGAEGGGCSYRPVQVRIRVTSRASGATRIVTTRKDGRGFVVLKPGPYKLTPLTFRRGAPLPYPPPPRTIAVRKGKLTDVIFDYESGRRGGPRP